MKVIDHVLELVDLCVSFFNGFRGQASWVFRKATGSSLVKNLMWVAFIYSLIKFNFSAMRGLFSYFTSYFTDPPLPISGELAILSWGNYFQYIVEFVNYCFPLDLLSIFFLAEIQLYLTVILYRFLKSWIPTLSG